jgi:cobalt-zinc-cadmium efflux system protein
MSHHHHHTHQRITKNLMLTIFLNIGITVAQVIGGLISGSLSLLSDALHNFTDVVSLIISYSASKFSKKKATLKYTFGYKRAEIIAAFINASTLIVVAFILIYHSIERFINPQVVESTLVIYMSILAILGNGFSVILLLKDRKQNMNITSAFEHLFTDMMASVAVLIGGFLMKYYQIYWVDSVLTFAIAIYLIIVGYKLFKDSFNVLMLFTPHAVEIKEIVERIDNYEHVKKMHHVHVWQLNEEETHLEAEIDFDKDLKLSEFEAILEKIEKFVQDEYAINHVTIQPEFEKDDDKNLIVQD